MKGKDSTLNEIGKDEDFLISHPRPQSSCDSLGRDAK